MKKIIMFLGSIILISACNSNQNSETASSNRIEITPFIETSVVLRDTTSIKSMYFNSDSGSKPIYHYNFSDDSYLKYLNQDQFKVFKTCVSKMMHNPGVLIYDDIYGAPLTKEQMAFNLVECDSVLESFFNEKGEEVLKTTFCCDSVSKPHRINMIKFYEAWYFNPATNIIEKDVLGYSVLEYDENKKGYRYLFNVIKNEEALAVFRKKWSL